MAAAQRRYTITVSSDTADALDQAKSACYQQDTWSEMLRDLIARGLALSSHGAENTQHSGCGK